MAHDPREPLSPEEAAVARAYTALPRPEPSPALDARVLAQARAALAPATVLRRTRPWYLMPGTGVAAAAVLAAGIAWQVGLLGDGRVQDMSSAPATAPADAAPAKREAERDDRLDVEFLRREQEQADQAQANDALGGAAAPKAEAKPEPAMQPPPTPGAQVHRHRAERIPQPFPQQPPPAESAQPMQEAAPAAPPPPAPAPAAAQSRAAAPATDEYEGTLDPITVTGSRIGRADTRLPPWPDDAVLAPADWLDRVRDRVRSGDREGARSSLRRFARTHPSIAVPDDLTLLLVQ